MWTLLLVDASLLRWTFVPIGDCIVLITELVQDSVVFAPFSYASSLSVNWLKDHAGHMCTYGLCCTDNVDRN